MVRTIIIGGGMSGTALAWRFFIEKQPFILLDWHNKSSASRAAAGLINPIVYRHVKKSWEADLFIPEVFTFFKQVENDIKKQVFHERNLAKVFTSIEEQNNWSIKTAEDTFHQYAIHDIDTTPISSHISTPFGIGRVKQGGYIDTNTYLDESHRFFKQIGSFKQVSSIPKFSLEQQTVSLLSDSISTNETDRFIFAEGHRVTQNKLFNWIPFKPVKGEVIEITSSDLNFEECLSKGFFILPTNKGTFKIGATYSWDETDEIPTEKGKQELLDKFTDLVDCKFKLVHHIAGIRPGILDRRPVIGRHPRYENAFVFNGTGSKGGMMIPFCSKHFIHHLIQGTPIRSDMNIERFYSKYNEKN